ncbi:carbon-nitrogen hydrolase family protein [Pleionea sediminis]|uniref:carbon-nitrogen hydrolase family protein n=1 Tax=Pleionea sediminis TaxID=2569479 RepID=UPI001185586C|nr:carbon-nitrogen hydrolase family protein [Pleionea sediminis]
MKHTSTLRLSVIQMCSGCDLHINLKFAKQKIAAAAADGAQLVILPEYYPLMGRDLTSKLNVQEQHGQGQIQDMMQESAAKYGVWIIGGSIPVCSDDPQRPYARCYVYDDSGENVGFYDKVHMFDVSIDDNVGNYQESQYSMPGEKPVFVESPWGKIGLAVCYDIRFPELFRKYAEDNVDLVALPSAFTVPTGKAHWEVLLRARAIENQCFIAGAAQAGKHENGRITWGHSMIINPWGDILGQLKSELGILTQSIEIADRVKLQEKLPVLEHRRIN